MACCKGTVSWFCCYPNTCGCDACCCSGSNCSNPCNATGTCGKGGCCNCNSANWGYAWWNGGAYVCGLTASCGSWMGFQRNTACNQGLWQAQRFDTGPSQNLGRMSDFTRSLFMQFAGLDKGLISGMVATPGSQCPC